MKWAICVECGKQVEFWAREEVSNDCYCWPCWIAKDSKASDEGE